MAEEQSKQKKSRKGLWIGLAVVFFAIIGFASTNKENKNTNSPTQNTASQNTNVAVVNTTPKTPEQILQAGLTSVVKKTGTTNVSLGDYKVQASDANRPAGTQMVTVNANVKDYYNKSAFTKDTGKLTSTIFQTTYGISGLNAYDVIVKYIGETTDKYGNKTNDTYVMYAIDKLTYQKVNWQNFDQATLCDFLKSESANTNEATPACTMLVNIQ